jgi:hypothetical protein
MYIIIQRCTYITTSHLGQNILGDKLDYDKKNIKVLPYIYVAKHNWQVVLKGTHYGAIVFWITMQYILDPHTSSFTYSLSIYEH